MYLSKAVSLLTFFLAFAIGVLPSYLIPTGTRECREAIPPLPIFEPAPVRAENMVGLWKGTWDKDHASCTLTIDRAAGEKFYGTLRKNGAVVKFVGTLDANSRTVLIQETKVINHGQHRRWSLGTNTGAFSLDGKSLTGTGVDEYGTYYWDASKD
ncbi:MAG TPA: hypothetical protein VJV05_07530 [Pyrinomonadaceae bacterium]|nr:hypothetical protein [Pyrinomonadaceae bacterium]